MAMIFNELMAIVPGLPWQEEPLEGPVLARELIPYAGKISWGFLERLVTNTELYDGLLHNSFADGRNGVNLWSG